MRLESYELTTKDGKHIRKASKLILTEGHEIKFIDNINRTEALRQVFDDYDYAVIVNGEVEFRSNSRIHAEDYAADMVDLNPRAKVQLIQA